MAHWEDRLGIIAMESTARMGEKVHTVLREWRGDGNWLIGSRCPRFASGEGKCVLEQSVRDRDLYILVDVANSSLTYTMDGALNRMSPDDHFQDLKRVISACSGQAGRITVIMPFLYEGRQHRRNVRESLDCAAMLRELENMGVHTVVTFDAHDPRMQAAIPYRGFENVSPALQFTQMLFLEYEDLELDSGRLMFVAPDEGATGRAVFMASLFGVNIGMFYKRRDFTTVVDGMNPIVAHDFCGESVEGKDCVVLDDMIASGSSIIDVARQLKDRGARRIFLFATFGLFTHGLERFDKAYAEGVFTRLFATNLTHLKPELEERPWFCAVHMERYIAALIDTANRGESLLNITKPSNRIRETIARYTEAQRR